MALGKGLRREDGNSLAISDALTLGRALVPTAHVEMPIHLSNEYPPLFSSLTLPQTHTPSGAQLASPTREFAGVSSYNAADAPLE